MSKVSLRNSQAGLWEGNRITWVISGLIHSWVPNLMTLFQTNGNLRAGPSCGKGVCRPDVGDHIWSLFHFSLHISPSLYFLSAMSEQLCHSLYQVSAFRTSVPHRFLKPWAKGTLSSFRLSVSGIFGPATERWLIHLYYNMLSFIVT